MPTTDASDSCSDTSSSCSGRDASSTSAAAAIAGPGDARLPTRKAAIAEDSISADAGGDRLAGQQREERDRRQRHRGRDRARIDVQRKPRTRAAAARDEHEQQRRHRRQVQPDTDSTCVAPATRNPSSTSGRCRGGPEHGGLQEGGRVTVTPRSIAARIARRATKAARRGRVPSGSATRVIVAASDAGQRVDAGGAQRQRRIGEPGVARAA
jgi:hypothetical protein